MRGVMMVVAGMAFATAAAAQVSVGNPPGNTVAPTTGSVTLSGPVAPTATGGDLAHAATPQLAAQKQKTEMVCKTQIETGSLIARKKTCLTRKQWQYVNDENQREAYKFVQDNTTKSSSN